MIIKVKRFNREKWDRDTEFYISELKRGHIDLISPQDKGFNYYWDITEDIDTEIFEIAEPGEWKKLWRIDNDFLIGDHTDVNKFSFTDWVDWVKRKGFHMSGLDLEMWREIQLMKIIG